MSSGLDSGVSRGRSRASRSRLVDPSGDAGRTRAAEARLKRRVDLRAKRRARRVHLHVRIRWTAQLERQRALRAAH